MKRRYVWSDEHKRLIEEPLAPRYRGHFVQPDTPGYESPIDGRWIEGRKARREDLKRHNCRPWEGRAAEEAEAAKYRAERERKTDQLAEKMAHRLWAEAPESARRLFRSK